MALTNGFVTTAGTTARDARLMDLGRITRNQDNTPRPGQLYGDSNAVKAASSMSVTLLGDTSWVLTRGKTDGVVVISNDGDVQVPLDPAPSANSRYDVIYLKQNDTEKGDANSQPIVGKVTGTAAASPTIPAVPSGALLLATVLVPAGVTATNASGVVVSNVVKFTALNGAPIRYRSTADMNADAVNVIDGATAYVKGSGLFFLRGNQWVRMDADTFVIVQQKSPTSINSGTTPGTLGGTGPTYESSDATVFPVRSDGVVGPVPFDCWVEANGNVRYGSGGNANTDRYIELTINDSSVTPVAADQKTVSDAVSLSVVSYLRLSAGDYVKLKGYQSSGSVRNYQSRLSVRLARIN